MANSKKEAVATAERINKRFSALGSMLRAEAYKGEWGGYYWVRIINEFGENIGGVPSEPSFESAFLTALPMQCSSEQFVLATTFYQIGHEEGSSEGYDAGRESERYDRSVFGD